MKTILNKIDYDCGPVALYNAQEWLKINNKINKKTHSYTRLLRLTKCSNEKRDIPAGTLRWNMDIENITKNKKTTYNKNLMLSSLKKGKALIIHYNIQQPKKDLYIHHYVFIEKIKNKNNKNNNIKIYNIVGDYDNYDLECDIDTFKSFVLDNNSRGYGALDGLDYPFAWIID